MIIILKYYAILARVNSSLLWYLQLATLTGHTYRVLYLAISPDGQVSFGDLFLSSVTHTHTHRHTYLAYLFLLLIPTDHSYWCW
jgi:hypothetical protein